MNVVFEFEGFTIKRLIFKRQVHFQVFNKELYVCRLVPSEAGFEPSKFDRALGIELPEQMLVRLSDFILQYDAYTS